MSGIRRFKFLPGLLCALFVTVSLAKAPAQDAANLPAPVTSQYNALDPSQSFPRYQSVPQYQGVSHPGPDDDRFIPPMTTLGSIAEGFHKLFRGELFSHPGANFPERAYWSPATIKLVNPYEYARIEDLDNDDPNSLFYTQRPNFFNQAVPDEWDWYNLVNTDRPDFTDTPFSVGEGLSILETGIINTRVNSPDAHSTLRSMPEALLRVGITNQFELRIKWLGYQSFNMQDPKTGDNAAAFGGADTDLGFKWIMFQQKNWFPLTTLVGGALIPTGTRGFSGDSVQPHFNFVQGWGIRRYIYLKHQFGLDYLTQPSFSVNNPGGGMSPYLTANHPTVNSYHSSISCLYQATKKIGGFVEWFALYGSNQQTTHFTDAGIFYYLTPTIQLDAVIGSSIATPDSNTLFTKFGFSTRW